MNEPVQIPLPPSSASKLEAEFLNLLAEIITDLIFEDEESSWLCANKR